jgi:hypothetical protein
MEKLFLANINRVGNKKTHPKKPKKKPPTKTTKIGFFGFF